MTNVIKNYVIVIKNDLKCDIITIRYISYMYIRFFISR